MINPVIGVVAAPSRRDPLGSGHIHLPSGSGGGFLCHGTCTRVGSFAMMDEADPSPSFSVVVAPSTRQSSMGAFVPSTTAARCSTMAVGCFDDGGRVFDDAWDLAGSYP